jgi:hypothetical protein
VPGRIFEMRLDVRTGRALSGMEAVLNFDPAILELEESEVEAGEWFTSSSPGRILGPILEDGRIKLGLLRTDPEDVGVLGEGTALRIGARVVGEGPMGLRLRGALGTGPRGEDIPMRWISEDHQTAGSTTGERRGDANRDGIRDISDAVFILGCLFLGGECPATDCAADANHDNSRDLSDAVFLLSHLFLGGPQPDPCN